ncbi:hypothetical protein C2R70_02200 [Helicobacter pylori]|nr:hypothetical protein C2R70_02200 [Helicobacter pylori]
MIATISISFLWLATLIAHKPMRPVPLIAILIGMFSLYLKITILSQMLLNKGILKGFYLINHKLKSKSL